MITEINSMDVPLPSRPIIGQMVDGTSYADATERVLAWADAKESRYVCVANVHVVMEACDSSEFSGILKGGDLVTPDGMPLVWALRLLGVKSATRVYGPELTLHICERAAKEGVPIGLYGGTEESVEQFVVFLEKRFPGIQVPCRIAPPFRPLTEAEDAAYTAKIAESGAQILFVGIGCPKQERWMAAHKGRLNMPMLGVGAAFDFHTGRVRQAPAWMQLIGMEWFFRFLMEPRRLFRRYAWHNPRFVARFALQWLRSRR